MDEQIFLAERFEEHRAYLQGVAYRMLGSRTEADDAIQESWLRLSRTEKDGVENLRGWLTTVVARICLDMLRSRKARRETPISEREFEPAPKDGGIDPEQEALLADSIGLALLVVLETLSPPERIAFVLHDVFDVPFEEIGSIVGRTPVATRQLASRARRRVQGRPAVPESDITHQRRVVDAFLTAARGGNFNALLSILSPDVVFRADETAMAMGSKQEVRGAEAVAKLFSGRAQMARAALVDGVVGVVVAPLGRMFLVLLPTIEEGKIVGFEAVAGATRLKRFELGALDA